MAISINDKIVLNSSYTGSTAIMDVDHIRGAFKVYDTYSQMTSAPAAQVSNNQIVWCEELEELFQATVTLANPPFSFTDSVSWSSFTGFGGGSGGTGDISAVLAGNGLTGGGTTGTVQVNVGAGNGITVAADSVSVRAFNGINVDSNGVSINTGSLHFAEGVQKTNLDGGDI